MLILSDETCVASVPVWDDDDAADTFREQSRANVAFIVRACNAHETFVATLRLALRALNTALRFRVEATDSYKIASTIERALRSAGLSPYPEITESGPETSLTAADCAVPVRRARRSRVSTCR